ncbi:MAG: hypothetical protein HFJ59_03945 [Clostridia bacterium]|nr:hypothetical protein [Clostridia bacterium]
MKTWEEMTKLETKTKVMIIFYIIMIIFSIIVAIINKGFTWILVALLWADVAIIEYCDGKLLKGREALNDIQEKHIKVQSDIINTLLNETAIEIDIQDIKVPKYFTKPNPKKLKEKFDYYKQHKRFKVPIIIDNDYTLIDGYTSYLIAKNYNKISVIAHLKRKKGDIYG